MTEATFSITVEPAGVTLTCLPGETMMQCATRHGMHWPTICRGVAQCSACRFEILEGEENFMEESPAEEALFRAVARVASSGNKVRFGCCAQPSGDVRVLCRRARYLTEAKPAS
ncbi:2Fe-2S iron-sulfur cluster-binding protein [Sphingobium sp. TKS]|uniref:2Fe-2S iron-sulfur cluster-binding protein n=1 Tax=Sphingobium sp. TKS TaxID=1315974 RepID=UPI00076FE192|nr:2Fe-2S iron-sulfur cluster-binding protein [Sphingobium sp. TKS]AMK25574.1 ferredoxin [Sphingobium sp. TKS]